jgi:hypothetical protein
MTSTYLGVSKYEFIGLSYARQVRLFILINNEVYLGILGSEIMHSVDSLVTDLVSTTRRSRR